MMQKRKATFWGSIALLVIITAGVGFYLINKLDTNVEGRKANKVISSENLYTQYEINEVEANKKYLNKVVEVTGEVAAIGSNNHQYYIILKTYGSK